MRTLAEQAQTQESWKRFLKKVDLNGLLMIIHKRIWRFFIAFFSKSGIINDCILRSIFWLFLFSWPICYLQPERILNKIQ